MSVANTGNYSFDLSSLDDNARKRYIIAVQRGKVILDSELSEIAFSAFTGLRNYLRINVGDGSIDDSFKIIESTSNNVDNFTIMGGASVEQPAMMFIKGIPALITGNIEYNAQKGHIALLSPITPANSDYFTESNLPGLTPPAANRTDIVYMDMYFAEVSSEVGSEYQDTTIKNPVIGVQTANRFRIVQDIRVAEGGVLPADGADVNGIYHRYTQLATINRIGGNNTITNAMIVDDRKIIISIKKLTDGTGNLFVASLTASTLDITGDINMQGNLIPNAAGTSNLGDATHRFANLFMASNIDALGGLTINHSGGTGQALNITRTGASTGNLLNVNNLFTLSSTGLASFANTANSTSSVDGSIVLAGGMGIAKDVSIAGVLRVPIVSGNVIFTGDVTIQGTTTSVEATNLNVTDKNITVNKLGNDASSEGAGLTVDRISTKGSLIYRSSAPGKFAIGDLGSEQNVVIESRSISVSGNGLSGGGDLSADRTIVSNGTDVNTPSTLVFRDSSGNFSAGTITASLNGNSTGTTPNSVTLAMMQQIPTNTLLGRSTSGSGNVELITVGSGLLLSGGTLVSNGGSVTSVSVATANGVSGTVANPTTTPEITIVLGDITPTKITFGHLPSETGPYEMTVLTSTLATSPVNNIYGSSSAFPHGRDISISAGRGASGSVFAKGGNVGINGGLNGTDHPIPTGRGDVAIGHLGGSVILGTPDFTLPTSIYCQSGILYVNAQNWSGFGPNNSTVYIQADNFGSAETASEASDATLVLKQWNKEIKLASKTGFFPDNNRFTISFSNVNSLPGPTSEDCFVVEATGTVRISNGINNAIPANRLYTRYDGALVVLGTESWTNDYSGSIGSLTLDKTLRIEGKGTTGADYRQFGSIMFGDDSTTPRVFISEHIDDSLLIHANTNVVYNASAHMFHNNGITSATINSSGLTVTNNLNLPILSANALVYSNGSNDLASVTIGSGLSFSGGVLSIPTGPTFISDLLTFDYQIHNGNGFIDPTKSLVFIDSGTNMGVTGFHSSGWIGQMIHFVNRTGSSIVLEGATLPNNTLQTRVSNGSQWIAYPGYYDGHSALHIDSTTDADGRLISSNGSLITDGGLWVTKNTVTGSLSLPDYSVGADSIGTMSNAGLSTWMLGIQNRFDMLPPTGILYWGKDFSVSWPADNVVTVVGNLYLMNGALILGSGVTNTVSASTVPSPTHKMKLDINGSTFYVFLSTTP